jgi:hypothetical protein
MPSVQFNILNQLQTPAFYADIFANRPVAGYNGRVFISTNTFLIYRDNGVSWDLIGGGGPGTITGSGTATQIAFFNSGTNLTSDPNLFFDNTNIRLGIGTNSPGANIDVHGTANVLMQLNNVDVTANANTTIAFQNQSIAQWRLGNYPNSGQQIFKIYDVTNTRDALTIIGTQINTALDFTAANITGNILVKSGGTSLQFLKADGSVDSTSYQPNITLTTTGTNGAATFIANTLNVPNYAPDLSGYVTLSTTQTITGFKTFNPSVTASGAIARGGYYTPALTAALNNDVLVGLDINPTFTNGAFTGVSNYAARFQNGNILHSWNQNGLTLLNISNTTSGTGSAATVSLTSNASSGEAQFGKYSPATTAYKIITANNAYLFNTTAGDIAILNDFGTGGIKFASGGSTTAQLTLSYGNRLLLGSTTDNNTDKLQVTGTSKFTGIVTASASTGNIINFTDAANNTGHLFIRTGSVSGIGSDNNLTFETQAVERGRFSNGGNFLIASTTDNGTDKLQVTGSGIFSTKISTTAGTNTFNTTSGNTIIGGGADNGKKLQVNGTTTTTGFSASGETLTTSATLSEQYYHVFQGAVGQTFTLRSPLSNNLQYLFINNTANAVTIAAATSTNIIDLTNTSQTSITVLANARTFLIADGNNKYYQIF